MGRPTKYSEEIADQAEAYVNGGWRDMNHAIPAAARLARLLKVNKTTLYEWAKHHERFSNILDDMNAEQEMTLIDMGLLGEYNSNIVKLVLGKHGYHDRVEQDLSSSDGTMKPIAIQVVGVDDSQG